MKKEILEQTSKNLFPNTMEMLPVWRAEWKSTCIIYICTALITHKEDDAENWYKIHLVSSDITEPVLWLSCGPDAGCDCRFVHCFCRKGDRREYPNVSSLSSTKEHMMSSALHSDIFSYINDTSTITNSRMWGQWVKHHADLQNFNFVSGFCNLKHLFWTHNVHLVAAKACQVNCFPSNVELFCRISTCGWRDALQLGFVVKC